MGSNNTIPFFSPQGELGDVPANRTREAIAKGGKPAVHMRSPQGELGYVPADRVQEGIRKGGKVVPVEGGPNVTWTGGAGRTAWQDITSIFSSQPRPIGDMAEAARVANVQEKAAGRSLPYRAGAAAATFLGADVPGMEQAKTPGEVLGHAGAAALPYAMGPIGAEIGERTRPLVGKISEGLYKSALQPSYNVPLAESQQAARTGMEFRVPVNVKGFEKLNRLIAEWGTKIDNVIAQDPYRPIDPTKTLGPVRQTTRAFSQQVAPKADLASIDAIRQEYMDRFTLPDGSIRPMTAEEAQKLKQGTYQRLTSRAYGEAKSAQIEAEKAITRGVKEQLAIEFPELTKLNPQQGKFLDLRPLIERALNRTGNHFINVGSAVSAGAAKVLTGSSTLGTGVGLLKFLFDIPGVKSRLAITLNRAGVPLAVATARISAYSVALARAYQAESAARAGRPTNQGNSENTVSSRSQ